MLVNFMEAPSNPECVRHGSYMRTMHSIKRLRFSSELAATISSSSSPNVLSLKPNKYVENEENIYIFQLNCT